MQGIDPDEAKRIDATASRLGDRCSTPVPAMTRGRGVNGDGLTPTEQRCHKAGESGLVQYAGLDQKRRARDEKKCWFFSPPRILSYILKFEGWALRRDKEGLSSAAEAHDPDQADSS